MFYIVMGVSGSGKSTIGKLLSDRLNCQFFDGDDFHSPSNIEKMRQGIPLNDADRLPWLLKLHDIIVHFTNQDQSGVIACSALKKQYRQIIAGNNVNTITWVYLRSDYQTISDRLKQRNNHFFNQQLLQSQFEILEEPENALTIDVSLEANAIVEQIIQQL